ncbi:hypothetical protein HDU76_000880 [Blyttiomyces sp. JEL0837]|nr:hypothetical protein HDU76_000880 [Blyttiomyces sp. JEL0837]
MQGGVDWKEIPVEAREIMLRVGLSDRDNGVKKKCQQMLCDGWFKPSQMKVVEFLSELGISFSPCIDDVIKALIASSYSKDRLGLDGENNWSDLSVEKATFLRVYCEDLHRQQKEDDLQNVILTLTEHAELLEKFYAGMRVDGPEGMQSEIITKQLLMLIESQDVSDEIGRRRMLASLQHLIVDEDMSLENLIIIAKGLILLSGSEQEACMSVAEILTELLEDVQQRSLTTPEATPEILENLALLQTLEIIKALFEVIEKAYPNDPGYNCLIHKFILGGYNKNNAAIKLAAIHCLGLACILDKNLALENVNSFIFAFQSEVPTQQIITLRIIFDLALMHGGQLLEALSIQDIIKHAFAGSNPDLVAISVQGAAKLLLLKLIDDLEILEALIVLYFHPSTVQNESLRQCLTCFFPIYCLSSHENQQKVAKVVVPALCRLLPALTNLDENVSNATAEQVSGQLLEWSDPQRLVKKDKEEESEEAQTAVAIVSEPLHTNIAIELLEVMLSTPYMQKDGVKVLNQLRLNANCGDQKLDRIRRFCDDLRPMLLVDATALKALKKFMTKIEELKDVKNDNEDSEEGGEE